MYQDRHNSSSVLVAVMEHGSVWPDCIQHCRRLTPDSVIIAQSTDETPSALAQRVLGKVAALESQGRHVSTGAIAAASTPSDSMTTARVQIALGLLRSMCQGAPGQGKLCLVGSELMKPEARHQLMALAGMLMSSVASPPPAIDVRFTDGAAVREQRLSAVADCPHAGVAPVGKLVSGEGLAAADKKASRALRG